MWRWLIEVGVAALVLAVALIGVGTIAEAAARRRELQRGQRHLGRRLAQLGAALDRGEVTTAEDALAFMVNAATGSTAREE